MLPAPGCEGHIFDCCKVSPIESVYARRISLIGTLSGTGGEKKEKGKELKCKKKKKMVPFAGDKVQI